MNETIMEKRISLMILAAVTMIATGTSHAAMLLVNERDASTISQWDTIQGTFSVFHNTMANDADLNPAEGSTYGWIAEHYDDYFARFVPGSGSGLQQQYELGQDGRTHYHYPKHITAFNGEVVVMSRNDATIWWYDTNGTQLGNKPTGNGTGQGIATNGIDLFVSFWNGSNSFFERYDSDFVLQQTISNPSGMGNLTNIVDFAYDPASDHFFGLATDHEQGTGTQTNTVLEFTMGGSVVDQYTLPFMADGIGQVPEPGTVLLLGLGGLALIRRPRN